MNVLDGGGKDKKYKYLRLLAERYPTRQSVYTEIINLQAILNLPKGTEHFMSDLHGEYEAFFHILNNCSGVIKEKVDHLLGDRLSKEERAEFCTLIYYPKEKLEQVIEKKENTPEWYRCVIQRLIDLAKFLSYKYPCSKIGSFIPEEYSQIVEALLRTEPSMDKIQMAYHKKIIDTLIQIESGNEFIVAFTVLIKRLAVDHLHIVGDIYDRGMRPDAILDMLMEHHSLDIEWGNHDILWMGAACGSEACIATVIRNSLRYRNMDVLEKGYAISLRPLLLYAAKTYPDKTPVKASLKAISILLFKIEGQLIRRNPEFEMEDRLLLDKIDYNASNIRLNGKVYPLKSAYFPTVDPADPYALTEEEQQIMQELKTSFLESERLQRHICFLYKKGGMYRCYNQNLMFHGCVPLDENGEFEKVTFEGETYSGKSYMDYADQRARQAYFGYRDLKALDFMWYLWCGSRSPLSGRVIKTFERTLVDDPSTWKEPSNAYYRHCNSEEVCAMILKEFGMNPATGHIINGHVPVKVIKGENPVKANGRVIVIDGGFCRAYQKTTGIAGYTLISNSRGLRLLTHQSFSNVRMVLKENKDIESVSQVVELQSVHFTIADTDIGKDMQEKINDLHKLLIAYQTGILTPQK